MSVSRFLAQQIDTQPFCRLSIYRIRMPDGQYSTGGHPPIKVSEHGTTWLSFAHMRRAVQDAERIDPSCYHGARLEALTLECVLESYRPLIEALNAHQPYRK